METFKSSYVSGRGKHPITLLWAETLLLSVSFAALLLIDIWHTVLQVRSPECLYLIMRTPKNTLELAALLNLAVCTVVFLLVFWVLITRRQRQYRAPLYLPATIIGYLVFWRVEEFFIRSLCVALAKSAALDFHSSKVSAIIPYALYVVAAIFIPSCGCLVCIWRPESAWKVVRNAALVLAPFAFFCAARASWQAMFPPSIVSGARMPQGAPLAGSRKPLVLWLMFDELDDQAVFHRPAGEPPFTHLEALRSTSIYAEHACEPADTTLAAIPGYTIGRKVIRVRWNSADDLLLQLEGTAAYVPWAKQQTVFHDAAGAGRQIAILGTYHPYCRLFGHLTRACEVPPQLVAVGIEGWWELLQTRSVLGAALLQLDHALPIPALTRRYDGKRFKFSELAAARHAEQEHVTALASSFRFLFQMLADPSIDFLFAHLLLPHPPALPDAFFKEINSNLRPGYTRDLHTVDTLVGEIRAALVATRRWDETTVVVTSDHTVRPLWEETLLLSPSLYGAIGRLRERNVPLLIKLPHQREGIVYKEPFSAIIVHGIVQGLVQQKFERPEQVIAFIRRNAFSRPCPVAF